MIPVEDEVNQDLLMFYLRPRKIVVQSYSSK